MDKLDAYIVHSLDMVNYLCQHGHRILKIENSLNDSTGKYYVCIFRNTDKLHEDIDNYMLLKSQKSLKGYRKKYNDNN